jgi:hypothetical protein
VGRLGALRCGRRSLQQAGAAAAAAGGKLDMKSQFSASQRRRPHLATGMTDRRTTEYRSWLLWRACGSASRRPRKWQMG